MPQIFRSWSMTRLENQRKKYLAAPSAPKPAAVKSPPARPPTVAESPVKENKAASKPEIQHKAMKAIEQTQENALHREGEEHF